MDKVSPVNGQPLPEGRKFTPGEAQREIARKGARASNEKKRRRKLIRETIEEVLSTEVKAQDGNTATTQDLLVASVVAKAIDSEIKGVRRFESGSGIRYSKGYVRPS